MRVEVFGTADRRLSAGVRLLCRRVGLRFRRAPDRVNVVFVSNRRIQELNRRFLGRDRPTDVLAFPAPPVRGPGPRPPSEIYVSRDQARIQAREYGLTRSEELRRLVLHGLLHLSGLSHRVMKKHEAGLPGPR
jgi:rRNA maturation RNase YbeY